MSFVFFLGGFVLIFLLFVLFSLSDCLVFPILSVKSVHMQFILCFLCSSLFFLLLFFFDHIIVEIVASTTVIWLRPNRSNY